MKKLIFIPLLALLALTSCTTSSKASRETASEKKAFDKLEKHMEKFPRIRRTL
ncbi:putative lipoprotein [Bacteriovorax sp. DB6_IX]|uniref:putative lipoprotein n=1 Tax=Bacteriovorax sp. DB6_IX TaxID=1353530 RepID=UPI00038A0CCB|nr:putative lipoprotein [Bacteriovorax sp. DB6_IX]EQC48602.1 putative lipoprotein [Bacteriovorax sp. DB6_IX]EQC52597.1 putative lipoprotein [Bacteriovorax sp. DB6_IX]